MDPNAAQAVMAVAFFGSIAITAISIAAVWIKRIGQRNRALPPAVENDRLARIEMAVEARSR
ncbi:MAG: hypothetical protein ABI408_06305 [Gemmatimonadaceae bacterium]